VLGFHRLWVSAELNKVFLSTTNRTENVIRNLRLAIGSENWRSPFGQAPIDCEVRGDFHPHSSR
jgi:hypothetical protein